METFRFTKTKLEGLAPAKQGQVEYGDTVVNGLRIRVGVSGIKSFCVSRKKNGKFFRATLGRFPALSVENARAKALEVLGSMVLSGQNPNARKRMNERATVTLREALDTYILSREHRLKSATAKQYRSILGNYSGDWLSQPLACITRDRVEARHKAITHGTVWHGADKRLLRRGTGQ